MSARNAIREGAGNSPFAIFLLIPALAIMSACAHRQAHTGATDPAAARPAEERKAKRMGYRLIEKDGQTFYCRRELATGSYLEKKTICLTYAQWRHEAERTQEAIIDAGRSVRPKPPNE